MVPFGAYHHIHLVGIKGVAMTALAQCLDDIAKFQNPKSKFQITGSDVAEDFVTAGMLKKLGFEIFSGFDPASVTTDIDLVIYTGAHNGKNNVEVLQAVKLGIPVMSHAEALGRLMEGKKGISVCGTGGKSTTAAMIAWILEFAGKNPSYAIGVGNVPNLGRTGKYQIDNGELTMDNSWFVAEADEYAVDPTSDRRPRFIYQQPQVIVCTNLTYDHPDIYPNFDDMKRAFESFFKTIPPGGLLLTPETLTHDFMPFELLIPGHHNQENAEYATQVARYCGIDEATCREALSTFSSTMRRFEYKGNMAGVEMYDDYAHTPDEIRSTIQAMREWRPGKRIVVAFQPHTYSRTKALFDGFVTALSEADEVILLDIFASAREQVDTSISSAQLCAKIPNSKFQVPSYDALASLLPDCLKTGDVFMTMGAGDIYKVFDHLNMDHVTTHAQIV